MATRTGIYALVNTVTGQMYVGQAQDIDRRLGEHRKSLRSGKHHCVRLQRAFSKYGQAVFASRVLEECAVSDLDATEQRFLDDGFAAGSLYNTARCAEAPARGLKHSPERRARSSVARLKLFATTDLRERLSVSVKAAMTDAVRDRLKGPKSAAARAAMSEAQTRRYSTPDGMLGHREAMAKRPRQFMEAVAARGRGWRANEAFVARHDEAMSRRSQDPEWRARMAEKNKAMAGDPSWREATTAGHRTTEARENHGRATALFWERLRADPVAYASHVAKIKAGKEASRGLR